MRRFVLTAACALLAAPAYAGNLIPGTQCEAFPDDSYFHADISALPVHARSDAWMTSMGRRKKLHPDFGPSFGALPNNMPYGIPITIVDSSHPKVAVDFEYHGESDHVPYPLSAATKVEGGSWTIEGDRHTLTVDKATCKLYETFYTSKGARWRAGSGAVWDMDAYKLRPNGWTSADAAGLPILPLLLRYEEVARGHVDHPIRFTMEVTATRYLWPARHHAGSTASQNVPPLGAHFRLKKNFPLTGFRADTKVILRAMKKHGLVLADNGGDWHFGGTADPRWKNAMLDELKTIPASAFEAVDTSSLMVAPGSMRVRQ